MRRYLMPLMLVAALRFVPYADMDAEGYGYLKYLFEE